jgi:NTP pyrophosphatase (non-canonical NTP hydrolase)
MKSKEQRVRIKEQGMKASTIDSVISSFIQNSFIQNSITQSFNHSIIQKMTITEAQQIIDRWINTTGIRYFNELTNTAILMEEVGEVARIMARQYGEQSFKKSDEEINLADEMADVLFVLMCLANQTGINLEEALAKNLEKKSIRDAERHKNNEKLK